MNVVSSFLPLLKCNHEKSHSVDNSYGFPQEVWLFMKRHDVLKSTSYDDASSINKAFYNTAMIQNGFFYWKYLELCLLIIAFWRKKMLGFCFNNKCTVAMMNDLIDRIMQQLLLKEKFNREKSSFTIQQYSDTQLNYPIVSVVTSNWDLIEQKYKHQSTICYLYSITYLLWK